MIQLLYFNFLDSIQIIILVDPIKPPIMLCCILFEDNEVHVHQSWSHCQVLFCVLTVEIYLALQLNTNVFF